MREYGVLVGFYVASDLFKEVPISGHCLRLLMESRFMLRPHQEVGTLMIPLAGSSPKKNSCKTQKSFQSS